MKTKPVCPYCKVELICVFQKFDVQTKSKYEKYECSNCLREIAITDHYTYKMMNLDRWFDGLQ